jgi:hypothetical protein
VSAAKTVADSGSYLGGSSWYFNPYYNMYTFLPGFGYGVGYGMGYYNPFGYTFWSPYNVYGFINTLPYYTPYAPVTGNTGGGLGHLIHTPVRIPNGVTPAVMARQTVAASSHAERAAGGGGGFAHGGSSGSGGGFSSTSSSAMSSSHSSGMSMGGHSGGGGGGGHK